MGPAPIDCGTQSKLSSVYILPERFLCDRGLGEMMKTWSAKETGFQKIAYQFILDLIDRVIQTNSANSVTRKGMSCFRSEIMYDVDDCYIFEMFRQLVDKLKEHARLTTAERKDSRKEFNTFVPTQRSRQMPFF